MNIKIVQLQSGKIYYETGSHYQPISFKPLEPSSFTPDFNLMVYGYTVEPQQINTIISLNQIRELRDALNKFLPKEI